MITLKNYTFFLLLIIGIKTYSQERIKPCFIQQVDKAASELKVIDPNNADPVSLTARLIWNDKKNQAAVIIKLKVLEGWHIYSYVPDTQPYVQSTMVLELPKGVSAITEWTKPASYPFEDNIFVYEGDVCFIRYFSVKEVGSNARIKAGLHYQTCDIRQCLPPDEKVEELVVTK